MENFKKELKLLGIAFIMIGLEFAVKIGYCWNKELTAKQILLKLIS